ncbi:MAG: carboxypeptidase regulatory-like domain-containing protein [Acidobacteriaceae bacterium]|nr:carboxypeptidase regulatory-like domain-containing protein [Acidobacteriaceae bacterium]
MSFGRKSNIASLVPSLVLSALLLVVCFGQTSAAYAQGQNTGTVAGNVLDVSGSVVRGASITLTESSLGRVVQVTTNAKGEYLFTQVPVGNYTLKVTAPTFESFIVNGIHVDAETNVREDARLTNGNVEATVTVEAAGTTIDTRSATIGTMLDRNLVESLPIDGENLVSLAALLPGVTNVNAPTTFTSDTGGPTYSVSGSRGNQNLFLFDGLIWNNVFYNTGLNYPPRLASEEVSVLLNNYKAQYGRNSGSIFNVLSRRGSNQFHGSVWEYYQNSYFNATDYITQLNPHLISNQFGATLGGPILRDKAFFFVSYGALRLVDGFIANSYPPTIQELGFDAPGVPHICSASAPTEFQGKQCATFVQDFAGSTLATAGLMRNPVAPANGGTAAITSLNTSYRIANPTTTGNSPCVTDLQNYYNRQTTSSTQRYLPTLEYPVECFDQVAMNFINRFLPVQQSTTVSPGVVPVAHLTAPQPKNDQNGLARVDLNLGRHTVDARFYVTNVNDITSNSVSNGVGIPTASQDRNIAGIYSGNIGDTWVLSANLLNVFRAGYKRYTYIIVPQTRTTLADLGGSYTQPGPSFLPLFEATNRFTVGSTNTPDSNTVTANLELDDSMSWQHGNHNVMFGGQFLQSNYLHRFYTEPKFVSEQQNTGVAISDFASGLLYTATVGNLTNLAASQPAMYLYAQDDWRATSRLTLNLGVRYELPFSWKESDGQGTTFIPGYQSQVFSAAPAGVAYQGDPQIGSPEPATKYHAIAPRIGFSYDVYGNGSFAIRGGFGLFYDTINANVVGVGQPFHYSAFYQSPAGGLSQPLQGQPAIPNDYYKGQTPQFVLPYTINYADRHITIPYTEAANIGFQKRLFKGSTLEMNYVGKFGRHQLVAYDQNPAIYDCSGPYYMVSSIYCPASSTDATASYTARVKYPGYNYGGQGIVDVASIGASSYSGLQIIYSQRAVKGINTYVSYSYSRSLDISSNSATNIARIPQPNHLELEYAASDYNATHIFNAGWTWKLPKTRRNGFTGTLLNGWAWGGIFNARTGYPINVTVSGDRSYTNERTQRPSLVPGQNPYLPNNRSRASKAAQWFNTAAFVSPVGGTFSNLRRNALIGPGYINTNMNAQKFFNFAHGRSIELRVDSFNVFNHPNLATPYASLASSSSNLATNVFGAVNSTVGTNNALGSNGRRLQFGFIARY